MIDCWNGCVRRPRALTESVCAVSLLLTYPEINATEFLERIDLLARQWSVVNHQMMNFSHFHVKIECADLTDLHIGHAISQVVKSSTVVD
jgi:hypothetical protein